MNNFEIVTNMKRQAHDTEGLVSIFTFTFSMLNDTFSIYLILTEISISNKATMSPFRSFAVTFTQ